MSAIGSGGRAAATNQGRFIVKLKPAHDRTLDADGVARQLTRQALGGARASGSTSPTRRRSTSAGAHPRACTSTRCRAATSTQLYATEKKLEATLAALPQLRDVTSDLQIKNPQINVAIDRDRASSLGVTVQQIEQALYNAYGAGQVSTIFTDNNQYFVVMELLPQYQRDLDAMRLLSVRAPNGTLVPLTALATVTETVGPLSVNHSGQLPSVTISFNLAPGVAIGDAVQGGGGGRHAHRRHRHHRQLLRRRPGLRRCAGRACSSCWCSRSR